MTSQQAGDDARLTIELFGPNVGVRWDAGPPEPLKLRSRKGLWLFALLALRPNKPVARDWAAGMLWPDSETARETLRRTLTDLRAALGLHSDLLEATHATLRLCLPDLSVDVQRFDAALKRGAQADLEQAIALYQGPLLEECQEAWIIADRNRYADAYRGALERLAAIHGEQGRYGEAASLLRLALATDPLRESACRALMEALAAGGEPAEAMFVYRNFRLLLRRDLNTEPSPPTVALYRSISSGNGVNVASAPAGVSPEPSASARTSEAPPAPGRPATNLPYPLTALLGREEEMKEIVRLLERSRLVTLMGTGGLGKTRLAIAVGHALLDGYSEGVWFVDLAAISDPQLVPAAAAAALGIREEAGKSVTETLAAKLRGRSLLLIVDNCEHVIDAGASFVRAIVTSCPGVRVLATSRQALGFTGEVVRALDPLVIPEPVPAGGVEPKALDDLLARSAALRLFVERAEAVQPAFRLTSQSLTATVEICRRLEGVPLALELAAARVATLPVDQVASLLQDRFRLLTDGDRTAPPRQQSLRALVDWSYELLHPREQEFFRRLSVFAGGWTVEAAVAVCDPDTVGLLDDADREETLDLAGVQESVAARVWDVRNVLEALVARSLVLADRNAEGEVRYRMLETLREYADERRRALDTQDETRRRHIRWYRRFADGAYRERIGANHSLALRLLDQDHDNYRLALQSAGPGTERMRLAAALYWYWYIHGHYSEGRSWSERALNECPDAPATLRTRLMKALGDFSWAQGDMTTARQIHSENLELQKIVQDRRMIAVTLNSLGLIDYHQGDCVGAAEFYRRSLEITRELGERGITSALLANIALPLKDMGDNPGALAVLKEAEAIVREMGDRRGLVQVLHTLSLIEIRLEDYETARLHLEEALAGDRAVHDTQGEATCIHTLGDLALLQGDLDGAERNFLTALQTFRRLGAKRSVAGAMYALAEVALARADLEQAGIYLRQSIEMVVAVDNRRGIIDCLRGISERELMSHQPERAVYIWAVADAEKTRLSLNVPQNLWKRHQAIVAAMQKALGEERFADRWRDGADADFHGAVARATDWLPAASEQK